MSQCKNSNTNRNNTRECLYDILQVSRNADSEQIKCAYRQQAKKWHPDKNIHNASQATIRFKEINEAYEILSDKHERAWYDAHRDAILRGIDKHSLITNNQNNDYDPNIDLMPYFSPFIFSSFDDNDSNSYYNIYNQLFLRIIELEKLSKKKTPIFGSSSLSYHKMKEFYSFWEAFESRRSFQFVTKYNLNDASNRKIRKLMHKENRNLINQKRKKWEDTILKLLSFIKKRDPRFRNYLIDLDKQKIEEQMRMKQYQKEIDEIMKEEQRKEREQIMHEVSQIMNEDTANESMEQILVDELFECVVCNKVFKSENTFISHKSSKKHGKALQHLKFQLNVENEMLFKGNADENDIKTNEQHNLDEMIAKQIAHRQNVDNETNEMESGCDNNNDDKPVDLDYLMALQVEQNDIIDSVDLFNDYENENENEDENENEIVITDTQIIALLGQPEIDIESLCDTYPSLTKEYITDLVEKNKPKKRNKKNKKYKKKKKGYELDVDDDSNKQSNGNDNENENENEEFMAQFKTFKKKSDFINKQKQRMNKYNNNNNKETEQSMEENKNNNKKKTRRRRRKNKDTQNQTNLNISTQPIKSKCNACNETFGSKNKLYDHLKNYPKHALKSQH